MKYPESMSLAERSARHEVRLLRGFYQHLAIYLLVNGALAAFSFFGHPEHLRFPFVMLGWGIGLAIHGLRVLLRARWLGRDWEESKVRERLQQGAGR
ncbi:MAG: 2TM domain-containing protein [Betaproteobacteria bacterium]